MNQVRPHVPVLGIPTRDIIFAFILAKLIATAGATILAGDHAEVQRLAVAVGSAMSAVIFVLLVMLGGKQSISAVLAATTAEHRPAGGLLLWAALAVIAGVAIRFGISGLVLGGMQILDPARVTAELDELAAVRHDPTLPLDALAVLLVLIDAANEEIVYRRFLQTFFCRRFGLWAGVIGVAGVFGVMHGSLPIVLTGIWLGLLYLCSGRLWVAILAHASTNLAVYLSAAMQQPGAQDLFFLACYVSAALMMAAMVLAALAVRKPPWHRD
jgi:membrane protease YdiL (CAAX protease family)